MTDLPFTPTPTNTPTPPTATPPLATSPPTVIGGAPPAVAPPKPYSPYGTGAGGYLGYYSAPASLAGSIVFQVDDHQVTVIGGGFDAKPKLAYGVCLEAKASKAAEADLMLSVPDFGVPDKAEARVAVRAVLREMRRDPRRLFFVGCKAGQGRTGLFLALLAKATGESNPVEFVRKHYSQRAVETKAQQEFVDGLDLTGSLFSASLDRVHLGARKIPLRTSLFSLFRR